MPHYPNRRQEVFPQDYAPPVRPASPLFINIPQADYAALNGDQAYGLAEYLSNAMGANVSVYVGGSDYRVWSDDDHVCGDVTARLIAAASGYLGATSY